MAVNEKDLAVNPILIQKTPCKSINEVSTEMQIGHLSETLTQGLLVRDAATTDKKP